MSAHPARPAHVAADTPTVRRVEQHARAWLERRQARRTQGAPPLLLVPDSPPSPRGVRARVEAAAARRQVRASARAAVVPAAVTLTILSTLLAFLVMFALGCILAAVIRRTRQETP